MIVFYLQCIIVQIEYMASQILVNELQSVSGLGQDPKGLDLWWKMLSSGNGSELLLVKSAKLHWASRLTDFEPTFLIVATLSCTF